MGLEGLKEKIYIFLSPKFVRGVKTIDNGSARKDK